MRNRLFAWALAGPFLLLLLLVLFALLPEASSAAEPRAPLQLVSPAEIAALPADALVATDPTSESEAGPVIEIDSPENLGVYEGPFPIRVRFAVRHPDGHPIDMGSLKLVYKKAWGIDITDRVRAYIAGTAIEIQESSLPTGRHTVEIRISDVEGNTSRRLFTVTIL